MSELKLKVEDKIWWKIGKGEISFWFDNWSNLGPLYTMLDDVNVCQNIKVNEVLRHGKWDWNSLEHQLPDNVKKTIISQDISIAGT